MLIKIITTWNNDLNEFDKIRWAAYQDDTMHSERYDIIIWYDWQVRIYARANMGHGPGRQIFRTRIFIVPFHDLSIDAYNASF